MTHKFVSVQQHRHETNMCLDELAVTTRKINNLEKRVVGLETEAATASTRCLIYH